MPRLSVVLLVLIAVQNPQAPASDRTTQIDFRRDVQPILRRHCYRCHGSKNQEADLQLNSRDVVLATDSIVTRHDSASSLLIQRLVDPEHGDLMPLDADPLSDAEVSVLSRWIDQGAPWPESLAEPVHWAYQPVHRPTLPGDLPIDSAIDFFVRRRLEQEGLEPSELLDRARLIRRVSLALTGVPPTPQQTERFLNDTSDNAYEKVVDGLLQSPRYGERWAVPWLDLARYADSNGFQADQIRDNWAYRDWVIRALNDSMPFDQFVTDQIAGDLRDAPTIDQRVATGLHRMTTCNVEAGVHPEANRVNQVVDRVNTTATVFLGTTLECAQCHDHKYDPFTQKDYYRLFAYFNNTPLEVKNTGGVTWDFYGPTMDLPMEPRTATRRETLRQQLAEVRAERDDVVQSTDEEYQSWLEHLRNSPTDDWVAVVPESFESSAHEEFVIEEDGAVLLQGSVPDTVEHIFMIAPSGPVSAVRIDVLTDDAIPGKGPGRGDEVRSNIILSEVTCQVVDGGSTRDVALQNPRADFSQKNWDVARAIDGDRKTGWAIAPQFRKPHWASFDLSDPIELKGDQRLRIKLGQYYGRGRVIGKPRVSVYRGDPAYLSIDPATRKLAGNKKLNKKQKERLRAAFEENHPAIVRLRATTRRIEKEFDALRPDTTLVMTEMPESRETYVMIRGDYESLGDPVSPGTPGVLPNAQPKGGDRMELAEWLTSRENPLLSRVTVNRWWAELFGVGIVATPEDFGTQGEDPTHPELLDWLASEFIDSGWSVKHIHKLMVMSQTFQQTARATDESRRADPKNRFLSRGPRHRLSAELIRDNALAISGLLSDRMYGPPIMPHQPDKIWRSVGRNQPTWVAAKNEDRFRRGVYVVWKRAAPYPSFINFDAPDRGSCTVNRGRSNTPLQALTLLNDPAYAEMALAMADRVIQESPATGDEDRIAYALSLAVSRKPSSYEVSVLADLLRSERERLADRPELIADRTRVPFESMSLKTSDRRELAAWLAVTNAILNLDETVCQ